MKHLMRTACLFVVFLLLFTPVTALASAPAAQGDWHERFISERELVLLEWNRQAKIQELMIIAVIVFGAGVTVLQNWTNRTCKLATIVLGAAVSVFTGVNAKLFQSDYRSLQAAAVDGKNLLDHLKVDLARYESLSPEDRAVVDGEFATRLDQFDQLRKKMLQASVPTAATYKSGWIPSAHADARPLQPSAQPPDWVANPPTDPYSLYYVGVGSGSNLFAAKDDSFNRAVANAARSLARNREVDLERVMAFVKSVATVANSSFTINDDSNPQQGSNAGQLHAQPFQPREKPPYTWYTLLRINRSAQAVVDNSFPSSR